MSDDVFTYRIDNTDTIVSVNSNWHTSEEENAGSACWQPDDIIGRSIWDFIQGIETQHLYKELFQRARQGKSPQPIPFRCDSSDERRFLKLFIEALPKGQLAITSVVVKIEKRSAVRLLEPNTPRSSDMLTICSMCKKIKIDESHWVEIEEALARLKLFEAEAMPQLTHGVCPDCYQTTMKELNLSGEHHEGVPTE